MKKIIIILIALLGISAIYAKATGNNNILLKIKSNYGKQLFITHGDKAKIGVSLDKNIFVFSNSLDEDETIFDLKGKAYDSNDFKFVGMSKGLFFYKNRTLKNYRMINFVKGHDLGTKENLHILITKNERFIIISGSISLNETEDIINSKRGAFIFSNQGIIIGILAKKNIKDLLKEIMFNFNSNDKFEIGIDSYFKGNFTKIEDMWSLYNKVKEMRRGWLGITYSLSNDYVRIEKVVKDSPAEKYGLKGNDIILKIEGKEANVNNLVNIIKSKKPGTEVKLTIKRGKKILVKRVVLGEKKLHFHKNIIINTKSIPDKSDVKEKLQKLQKELNELKKELEE
ncbi:PDZ domain-containing protein [bacterium]|nr:PDZ domain-containing protein [bacterium]